MIKKRQILKKKSKLSFFFDLQITKKIHIIFDQDNLSIYFWKNKNYLMLAHEPDNNMSVELLRWAKERERERERNMYVIKCIQNINSIWHYKTEKNRLTCQNL